MVLQDLRVNVVQLVLKVIKVIKEKKESRDLLDLKVQRVQTAQLLDLLVLEDSLERQVLRDRQVQQEPRLLVQQALRARLVLLVDQRDQRVQLDLSDLLVHRGMQVFVEQRDQQDLQVPLQAFLVL
jgi:hypothetical protein